MTRVADAVSVLERAYPPALAESWDAVGLVCGLPSAPLRSVLVAVDPTPEVVEEACDREVDLLVVHHPLLLRPVTSVAALTAKGRIVHRLISAGVALFTAHTNADSALPGVSDALATALGVHETRPLSASGLGRVGALAAPVPLAEFSERVAAALPVTAQGVRVSGDAHAMVRTVAVCGGAGDSLLPDAVAAGVDVYVTADLRHHRALEHRQEDGCALIDVSHWASEWPWCAQAADLLSTHLPGASVMTSSLVTDPWSWHVRSSR